MGIMAVADYKKYMAENVLNERRTVTYRSLSRALRVHSTLAKQMLYDFHRNENGKRPQSVNANYVVTGTQKAPTPSTTNGTHTNGDVNHDADDVMQSSPYLDSSMPNQDEAPDTVATASMLLVREEDLEDAKSTFQSISSIYVYSLQPTALQDLNVLTDVSREMAASYAHEDPLQHGKQWGMIQNNNVKRRTGMRPPAPAPAPATSSKPVVPSKRPNEASEPVKAEPKKEDKPGSEQSQRETAPSSSKPTEKTAPVKREKSNLFSSFAKAKPKQKKEESAATTPASATESAEPSGLEDVVLDDASDEEEAEELFPDTGKSTSSGPRESRKDREEKLKQMMENDDEDEDEEMPDVPEPEEESKPIDQPAPKPSELKEEVTVGGGRRRGKRQIMKKKTVKDDEGYLVTVEEPSWESFSEDEPAPPPPKKKPAVSAPKAKSGTKPGQGNIMSFFSKK